MGDAGTGDEAGEEAAADRVAAAAAELYGGEPEEFTDRRKALAASAKAAGDRDAAAAIAALRKPTRAAWVVNRLARADPGAPDQLAALAAALRAAEQGKDGARLRELSAERWRLIDALTAAALSAASVPDPPTSLRDEVTATLTAALADPETAAEFAAGTLTRAAHWAGFGAFDLAAAFGASAAGAGASADASSPAPTRLVPSTKAPRGAPAKLDQPREASPSRPSRPSRSPRSPRNTSAPPDEVGARRAAQERRAAEEGREAERRAAEQRRAAALQQQLAREAAEREAERRKKYEDGERTVASASAATAEAEAAEDRLEAEVRDLEERLTKAREDLAAVRRRARHAEAAERRARQTLHQLPRP